MHFTRTLVLTGGLALATIAAQPAGAQQAVDNPPGVWIHAPSGTAYPRFLGAAERTSITEFDAEGRDASTGYSMRTDAGVLILTLYVYPAIEEMDCAATFDDAQMAITQAYQGEDLLSEADAASPGGTSAGAARLARYTIPEGGMRAGYPAMVSDLYLHCPASGDWLVKYRASWSGSAADFPDVAALLAQVSWGPGLE